MKRIWLLFISLSLIYSGICEANDSRKKWKIVVGSNFTEFRTTNSMAGSGYSIGFYRQGVEQKRTNIQFGMTFQKRLLLMEHKTVELRHEFSDDHETIYDRSGCYY